MKTYVTITYNSSSSFILPYMKRIKENTPSNIHRVHFIYIYKAYNNNNSNNMRISTSVDQRCAIIYPYLISSVDNEGHSK